MAELGERYRDTVTGYKGTATARTEFLFDSPSIKLTRANDKGRPEDEWFPEARVEPDHGPDVPSSEPVGFGGRTED